MSPGVGQRTGGESVVEDTGGEVCGLVEGDGLAGACADRRGGIGDRAVGDGEWLAGCALSI